MWRPVLFEIVRGLTVEGKLRLAQVIKQECQRLLDILADISVRHAVPHQILRLAQLVVGLARHRELNLVTLRSQRFDLSPSRRLGLLRCEGSRDVARSE